MEQNDIPVIDVPVVADKPAFKRGRKPRSKPEPYEPTEAVPQSSSSARISVPLTEDGKAIDWQSMREETRARLRDALGLKETTLQVFTSDEVAILYRTLGPIEAMIFSKIAKIDSDIALQSFAYTDGEIAILDEPTKAVMNKYVSPAMLKYKDEVMLFLILLGLNKVKFENAMMLMKQRHNQPVNPIPDAAPKPSVQ